MTLWLDAHLSPLLAPWIESQAQCQCAPFRTLGLQRTPDRQVFLAARLANAVILSKDSDFPDILRLLGPPPKVIWLRCGNRSTRDLQALLMAALPAALKLLESDDLVEIKDAASS